MHWGDVSEWDTVYSIIPQINARHDNLTDTAKTVFVRLFVLNVDESSYIILILKN